MAQTIQLLTVEKDHDDGVMVTFSDGTTAGYVEEELLKLRPHRESTEDAHEKFNSGDPASQLLTIPVKRD